jgi:hypothetical protein
MRFKKIPYNLSIVDIFERIIFSKIGGKILAVPAMSPVFYEIKGHSCIVSALSPRFNMNVSVVQIAVGGFRIAAIIPDPEFN